MGKFDVSAEDGALVFKVDLNEDGEPVVHGKLNFGEGIQEAFQRGEAIEGAKVVSFKFDLSKLVIAIDTDKDGEKLLELTIDLAEAIDETGLLKSSK